MHGPCASWPLVEGCGTIPTDPAEHTPAQSQAVEAATELLWRLTAGRFGLCPQVLRPCRTRCTPERGLSWPYVHAGQWYNPVCTSCPSADRCSCALADTIRLPGPVHADDEHPVVVRLDGAVFTGFAVFAPDRLVRTDGQHWPDCQDLALPADQAGTWEISYHRGIEVPIGGRRAVSMLASEMHKACTGDRSCKLPARVRDVQREGVSYTFIDPQDFLAEGRTGLTEVDLWLRAVNPRSQHTPSTVWSPDMRGGRVPYGR